MTSFDSELFKKFKLLNPQGLPSCQAVINCTRAHNSDVVLIATSDCKLTAFRMKEDTFKKFEDIAKYRSWVVKCEISMDNTYVVVLVEKKICVYNMKKRFVLVTEFRPHMSIFNDISWSKNKSVLPEKQLLATCGKDGTIRVWRAKDLIERKLKDIENDNTPYLQLGVYQDPHAFFRASALEDPGHLESVVCIAFDKTDEFILSGGVDYRIIMWSILKGGTYVRDYEGGT